MPKRLSTTEQYGDIRKKLDAEAHLHNGYKYDDFDLMCIIKVPRTAIARLFNVRAAKTVQHWQEMREEMNNGND